MAGGGFLNTPAGKIWAEAAPTTRARAVSTMVRMAEESGGLFLPYEVVDSHRNYGATNALLPVFYVPRARETQFLYYPGGLSEGSGVLYPATLDPAGKIVRIDKRYDSDVLDTPGFPFRNMHLYSHATMNAMVTARTNDPRDVRDAGRALLRVLPMFLDYGVYAEYRSPYDGVMTEFALADRLASFMCKDHDARLKEASDDMRAPWLDFVREAVESRLEITQDVLRKLEAYRTGALDPRFILFENAIVGLYDDNASASGNRVLADSATEVVDPVSGLTAACEFTSGLRLEDGPNTTAPGIYQRACLAPRFPGHENTHVGLWSASRNTLLAFENGRFEGAALDGFALKNRGPETPRGLLGVASRCDLLGNTTVRGFGRMFAASSTTAALGMLGLFSCEAAGEECGGPDRSPASESLVRYVRYAASPAAALTGGSQSTTSHLAAYTTLLELRVARINRALEALEHNLGRVGVSSARAVQVPGIPRSSLSTAARETVLFNEQTLRAYSNLLSMESSTVASLLYSMNATYGLVANAPVVPLSCTADGNKSLLEALKRGLLGDPAAELPPVTLGCFVDRLEDARHAGTLEDWAQDPTCSNKFALKIPSFEMVARTSAGVAPGTYRLVPTVAVITFTRQPSMLVQGGIAENPLDLRFYRVDLETGRFSTHPHPNARINCLSEYPLQGLLIRPSLHALLCYDIERFVSFVRSYMSETFANYGGPWPAFEPVRVEAVRTAQEV